MSLSRVFTFNLRSSRIKNILLSVTSLVLCSLFSFSSNIDYFSSVPSVGETQGAFLFDNIFISFLVNCTLLLPMFFLNKYLTLWLQEIGVVVLFYGCLQSTNFLVFQQYACQWQTCDASLWQFHFVEYFLWSIFALFIFWRVYRRIKRTQ